MQPTDRAWRGEAGQPPAQAFTPDGGAPPPAPVLAPHGGHVVEADTLPPDDQDPGDPPQDNDVAEVLADLNTIARHVAHERVVQAAHHHRQRVELYRDLDAALWLFSFAMATFRGESAGEASKEATHAVSARRTCFAAFHDADYGKGVP